MDEEIRRKVCRLIAGIVVVDDDLDAAEDAFVDRMLDKFGLATEERDALFPIMDSKEAAAEFASLAPAVQKQAFDLLVEAAAADRQYADEERNYLKTVGAVMGLGDSEVEARVQAVIAKH